MMCNFWTLPIKWMKYSILEKNVSNFHYVGRVQRILYHSSKKGGHCVNKMQIVKNKKKGKIRFLYIDFIVRIVGQ